jgi:hypothetical protein
LDVRQIYALWPLAGGGLGLIPLSPWLHRWQLDSSDPMKAYFYAGRNQKGLAIGIETNTWSISESNLQHSETQIWHQALEAVV